MGRVDPPGGQLWVDRAQSVLNCICGPEIGQIELCYKTCYFIRILYNYI